MTERRLCTLIPRDNILADDSLADARASLDKQAIDRDAAFALARQPGYHVP